MFTIHQRFPCEFAEVMKMIERTHKREEHQVSDSTFPLGGFDQQFTENRLSAVFLSASSVVQTVCFLCFLRVLRAFVVNNPTQPTPNSRPSIKAVGNERRSNRRGPPKARETRRADRAECEGVVRRWGGDQHSSGTQIVCVQKSMLHVLENPMDS